MFDQASGGGGSKAESAIAEIDLSSGVPGDLKREEGPLSPQPPQGGDGERGISPPPARELEHVHHAGVHEENEDEYEYFDEHGNRIDPADLHEGHIIIDEHDADPYGAAYTEAELAAIQEQKELIRELNELPVAERLYAQRNIHRPLKVKYSGKKVIDESEQCTFKPKTRPYVPPAHAGKPSEAIVNPTGWDESIARMRAAAEKKRLALLKKAEEHIEADKAYQKSLKRSAEGFKVFSFQSEERIRAKKDKDGARKQQPRLYIDVKLSKNHVVNLALHDGDDPHAMAGRFCAIYGLANNTQSKAVLEEVIRQSMEVNGIEIASRQISTVDGWSKRDGPASNKNVETGNVTRVRRRAHHHHHHHHHQQPQHADGTGGSHHHHHHHSGVAQAVGQSNITPEQLEQLEMFRLEIILVVG